MSELENLRLFVEVVDSGGFNRAAKRLGLSKSIVSRRIAQMEANLGVRLVSRTTRGISPTDAGVEFKARGARILAEYEEARDAVTRRGGDVAGLLRLSVPLSFGLRHVAPVLTELAVRYPRLEFDVSYSDRVVDLFGERFDAAIRIGLMQDSALVARRIAPSRAVVVASPAYVERRGAPQTPAELASHDCLIYTGSLDADWHFRVGKRSVAVRPKGRLRSDSGEAIMQWALAGLGVTVAPTFIVSEEIGRGTLVPLLLDYATPEFGVYIVRSPGSYVPGKLRVLIDTLAERFADNALWDPCLQQALTSEGEGARS